MNHPWIKSFEYRQEDLQHHDDSSRTNSEESLQGSSSCDLSTVRDEFSRSDAPEESSESTTGSASDGKDGEQESADDNSGYNLDELASGVDGLELAGIANVSTQKSSHEER